MYGYFFPENGQRYMRYEFDTVQEALDSIVQRGTKWSEIYATNERDEAAVMNDATEEIVVIREIGG